MLESLLFEKYAHYGIRTSSEIYLPLNTATMFVEECSSFKVAIIGLEFFHIESGMRIPVIPMNGLDCSIFLTTCREWDDVVTNCNETALNVLHLEEEVDTTQYYNPTLLEKSEWR
jgi:hypothetical protein